MSDLKNYLEQRAAVEKEITALKNTIEKEDRNFNDDEIRSFDDLIAKRDAINNKVNTLERLEKVNSKDESRSVATLPAIAKTPNKYSKRNAENMFKGWIQKSVGQAVNDEYRSLLAGNDMFNSKEFTLENFAADEYRGDGLVASPYGANTIEDLMTQRFDLARKTIGGLRNFADVHITGSGGDLPFYYINDVATNAAPKTKGAAVAHTDMVVEKVVISATTNATGVYPIPKETLRDTSAKVLDRVSDGIAQRIYRKQNADATTALLAAIGDAGDTASTTSITYANLVDLQHSVDFGYNNRRAFCFHQSTLAHLKKMEDDEGRPLWNEGVAGGAPNTILGEPYFINNNMPELGANDRKVIAYGDWYYFVIREVNGIEVQALYERFAELYAIGVIGVLSYGFGYVMPDTLKYLSTPSA